MHQPNSNPSRLERLHEVVVVIGKYKGTFGKITEINLKKMLVYVDSVKVKKASGQEVNAKIDPSNLKIVKLNLDDKKRLKFIERKKELLSKTH